MYTEVLLRHGNGKRNNTRHIHLMWLSKSISDSFVCRWFVSHKSTNTRQSPLWQSVDVIVQRHHKSAQSPNGTNEDISNSHKYVSVDSFILSDGTDDAGRIFLLKLLTDVSSAPSDRWRAAKLIIPRVRGYIVRSDIIPLRMTDAPNMIYASSFAYPQQWFPGVPLPETDFLQFRNVLSASAGGVIFEVGQSEHDLTEGLDIFETELRYRLSFPWITEQRRPRQTLAFVGNYLRYPGHGGTGRNHYAFAKALDINLVVLDSPECWLRDEEHSALRGAFIPCDLSRDSGLCDRVVEALSQYKGKVNGIVSFHESLQSGVAKAAEILSLPTLPAESFAIAADKYATGVAADRPVHLATCAQEAQSILVDKNLQYPLILKPCWGWASEGVFKADSALDFTESVEVISQHASEHGPRFVIEEYCDGPEVDVNMVLSNGKLLFAEVCDETPKKGDGLFDRHVVGFLESDQSYPSRLPLTEVNMLVKDIHQILMRLGLHTGSFHLEARVKDSKMGYIDRDGRLELASKQVEPGKAHPPSTWLIEINARPPGIAAAETVRTTYGVDYVGLGLLAALEDHERMKALSHPFIQGPQYWSHAVFIMVQRGGIFDSGNVCDELIHRRPDLAQHISSSGCLWRRGEVVPAPKYAA